MKIPTLDFYATRPHPCSYLADHEAVTVFADPGFPMTLETYSQLSELGFRRSGDHIYRPHCHHCQACIPIRIPVHSFQPDRQQRRCQKRNQDLTIEIVEDIRSGEHYRLYERYIKARHRDGDMYPATLKQYESFLSPPAFSRQNSFTIYIEFRLGQQLMAVAVTDILNNGLSAVYSFYEPDDSVRSLGVFCVLFQIELTRKLGLPHLYLGYWIDESPKMSYKQRYQPHELLRDGRWTKAE